jgi:hypothetical protein
MENKRVHFFWCFFEENILYIFRISSLCKGSVIAAAADRRPLISKSRWRPQTDPYVTVVENISLEMFFPDNLGFQYSSFIHHRRYITTVTDRILKNTLQVYEILKRNFKKIKPNRVRNRVHFRVSGFQIFGGYISY